MEEIDKNFLMKLRNNPVIDYDEKLAVFNTYGIGYPGGSGDDVSDETITKALDTLGIEYKTSIPSTYYIIPDITYQEVLGKKIEARGVNIESTDEKLLQSVIDKYNLTDKSGNPARIVSYVNNWTRGEFMYDDIPMLL